ncbi:protein CASC3 isoform X2 [Lingula anatina]|uniref:Protein CASC3 n=1 Tax=Lingula anatina TaxID=7574 RepID=A0A1S3H5A9_LINAN|nr:protein CASC3 isoform X2 [Lingula anatina]|eukprot:XP_013381152.1 protein CASC3 isoform X2 [Lingula anatina]
MADRRRRRSDESSHSESEASADEATEIPTLQKNKKELRKDSECLSEGEGVEVTGEGEDSEYESAEEDQDEEEDEEEEDEEEYDDEDSVIIEDEDGEELGEERQSGDGEEQPASSRELDDDEDRKNPAFVPRKGNFYEHDSRMGSEEIKEEEDRPKKTLWKDEGKWLHDKFYDDMQAPKSKEEIIAMYGYDIRAYDKPPEAPRRFNSSRDGGYRKRNTKLSDFVNEEDMPRQRRGPPRGRGGRGRAWQRGT